MPVGELYKRLVLFDDDLPPDSYHSYYQKVRDTIKEATGDFPKPITVGEDFEYFTGEEIKRWFERWFGND